MENPADYLIERICAFFLRNQREEKLKANATSLIQLHHEKLSSTGDISFPSKLGVWHNYYSDDASAFRDEAFALFNETEKDEGTQIAAKEEAKKEFLSTAAKDWLYPVERIQFKNERCALFLQRCVVTSHCLRLVLQQSQSGDASLSYGHLKKIPSRRIHVRTSVESEAATPQSVTDLSLYRAKLVKDTLSRLLQYSTWSDVSEVEATSSDVLQLQVVSVAAKGTRTNDEDNKCTRAVLLKCGIVCDPATGKLARLNTQDYLNLRANDMRLMAMHKYGIRVKDDKRFCALIERLGAAAVTVDLLEVKHSSPVQIIRNGQGSTKGASFILYNSARLETLLRSFEERVQNYAYGQLPPIDEIDFSLLNEEEEWQLVYGYIFAFPNLIESCLDQLHRGVCATHLLVRFLSGFVALFSVYYRRIRILTEKRDHLMPYVYARIYLIKAVCDVLNKMLALLDIEPVSFM